MDHAYIEQNGLIDRYRQGLLEPDEEARFEEHFVGCAECTRELDVARSFARGAQAMAAEDAAIAATMQHAVVAAGLFAWLARRGRLARGAAGALVLLLAAGIPAAWWVGRRADLGVQAAGSSATAASAAAGAGAGASSAAAHQADAYRQRWQTEHARAEELIRQLQAAQAQGSAERARLQAQLASGTHPSRAGSSWSQPLLDAPLILLHTFRDAPAVPPTIAAAQAAQPLSLAVDAGDDPRFASYGIELQDAAGRRLVQRDGLHPNALGVLMITFPPAFLAAGDYRLTVTGIATGGARTPIGTYPVRVASRQSSGAGAD
jgi:hypothetical protein